MKRGMDTAHGPSAAHPVPKRLSLPKRSHARVLSPSGAPFHSGAGEGGVAPAAEAPAAALQRPEPEGLSEHAQSHQGEHS